MIIKVGLVKARPNDYFNERDIVRITCDDGNKEYWVGEEELELIELLKRVTR